MPKQATNTSRSKASTGPGGRPAPTRSKSRKRSTVAQASSADPSTTAATTSSSSTVASSPLATPGLLLPNGFCPPRAANAFLGYKQDAKVPPKEASAQWNALGAEDKMPWIKMAKQREATLLRLFPHYRFIPKEAARKTWEATAKTKRIDPNVWSLENDWQFAHDDAGALIYEGDVQLTEPPRVTTCASSYPPSSYPPSSQTPSSDPSSYTVSPAYTPPAVTPSSYAPSAYSSPYPPSPDHSPGYAFSDNSPEFSTPPPLTPGEANTDLYLFDGYQTAGASSLPDTWSANDLNYELPPTDVDSFYNGVDSNCGLGANSLGLQPDWEAIGNDWNLDHIFPLGSPYCDSMEPFASSADYNY